VGASEELGRLPELELPATAGAKAPA
jgi:hypothetical protein